MKITPSLAGAMSGSMGGVTASHNRGGAYLRRRSVPVNPNTHRQQAVRSILGGLVQAWNAQLDASQRQSWLNYAQNVPVTDRLGMSITLTGQNMFVRTNTPNLQAFYSGLIGASGITRYDDAPTVFNTGEPAVEAGLATIASDALTVGFLLAAPASDDGDALLYVGAPQNPTRNYFKGPYQLAAITAVAADATTASFTAVDMTNTDEWQADYVIQIDDRVPVRVVMLYDDGRVSQSFETFIVPEAPP